MCEGAETNFILNLGFQEFDSLHASIMRLHSINKLEQAEIIRAGQAPQKEYSKWAKEIKQLALPPQAKKKGDIADVLKFAKKGYPNEPG